MAWRGQVLCVAFSAVAAVGGVGVGVGVGVDGGRGIGVVNWGVVEGYGTSWRGLIGLLLLLLLCTTSC